MLIAHVTFSVAEADRDAALAALKSEIPVVRAMPGCVAFVPFADADNPSQIGVLHEWEDADAFAGYVSSDTFKQAGETLRPMMTAPPISKRFDAELIESVN